MFASNTITAANSTFIDTASALEGSCAGGALAADETVTVSGSLFVRTAAPSGGGGAVCARGDLRVASSEFLGTSAGGVNAEGCGGALRAMQRAAVVSSQFRGAVSATQGGAICAGGNTTIDGSTFTDTWALLVRPAPALNASDLPPANSRVPLLPNIE